MSHHLLWRALGVQALTVAVLFVFLLALPLERDFFRDWGAVTGPLAWIVASVVTWRALPLPVRSVAIASAGGGLAGLLAGLALGHGAGLGLSLGVFAALCAALARRV